MFVVRIEEAVVVCVRNVVLIRWNWGEWGVDRLYAYIYGQLEEAGQKGCFGMCLCESA